MTAKVAWEGVESFIHETGKKFFIIEENTWYKILYKLEQLELLKKKIYHRSSEKLQDNLTQLLFPEIEQAEPKKEKTVTVIAHQRRPGGRKSLSDKLPRVERIIKLSESERTCNCCGGKLVEIGDYQSERLQMGRPSIYIERVILAGNVKAKQ